MKRPLHSLSLACMLVAALVLPTRAQAPGAKLAFDTGDPLALASSYTATLQVNAGPATAVPLTCTAPLPGAVAGALATCTTPLAAVPAKGDVFKLVLSTAGGSVQTSFTDPGTPTGVGGLRIIIIIQVT